MQEVLKKAQELAEAVVASETYVRMKELEGTAYESSEARAAVALYAEKRQALQELFASGQTDRNKVAQAAKAVTDAEEAMNQVPSIAELEDVRAEYNNMMDNVNRIIDLIVNGNSGEGGCSGNCSGCGGGCSGCGETCGQE